jgi:hypothetical protein
MTATAEKQQEQERAIARFGKSLEQSYWRELS